MEDELNKWKYIAAYLASCHAATLEQMPKSWSRSQRERFGSIALKAANFLNGVEVPRHYGQTADWEIKAAADRCLRNISREEEP